MSADNTIPLFLLIAAGYCVGRIQQRIAMIKLLQYYRHKIEELKAEVTIYLNVIEEDAKEDSIKGFSGKLGLCVSDTPAEGNGCCTSPTPRTWKYKNDLYNKMKTDEGRQVVLDMYPEFTPILPTNSFWNGECEMMTEDRRTNTGTNQP